MPNDTTSGLEYCRAIIGPMAKPRRSSLGAATAGTRSNLRYKKIRPPSQHKSLRWWQPATCIVEVVCGYRWLGSTSLPIPLPDFGRGRTLLAVGAADHVQNTSTKVGKYAEGAYPMKTPPLSTDNHLPDEWLTGVCIICEICFKAKRSQNFGGYGLRNCTRAAHAPLLPRSLVVAHSSHPHTRR